MHSGRQAAHSSNNREVLTFGTRSGTRNGIETHIFRVETQRDLAHWSRALVQGSHGAAAIVKEVTCRKFTDRLLLFTQKRTKFDIFGYGTLMSVIA